MKKMLTFIFCVVVVCVANYVSVNKVAYQKRIKTHYDYNTVIEVWSVDSFEGGCGSRRDFLNKTALQFEKKHSGVLISVVNYTAEGVKQAIKEKVPDIISCGNGLSEIAQYARSVNLKNSYGVLKWDNREYGAVWCRGTYIVFGGNLKRLVVSQAEYTQPLIALKQSGLTFEKVEVTSPEKAYYEYLKGGCSLLGTQRDYFRLLNKQSEYEYQLIGEYSDLFMLALVTTENAEKIKICTSFLSYLLSEKTQKRLTEIGMLSTCGYTLYKGDLLSQAEKIKVNSFTSFFTDSAILKQMQQSDLKEFEQLD